MQTIREEKWEDLDKFVIIVDLKKDEATGAIIETFQKVDSEELKEKVIARFQKIYGSLKPGKNAGARLNEKNKSLARIT